MNSKDRQIGNLRTVSNSSDPVVTRTLTPLALTCRCFVFVGLRPCEFYGNFNMNNTTDVELALVNSQTVIILLNSLAYL